MQQRVIQQSIQISKANLDRIFEEEMTPKKATEVNELMYNVTPLINP